MSMKPPIALFTYNRPTHTQKVLESILSSEHGMIYVFSDGPRGEEDRAAVENIREYVRSLANGSTTLIEREENLGLANSILKGINYVFEEHESVIVLEDDVIVEQAFYPVMGKMLEHYRNEPKVFSISGYGFPLETPLRYQESFYPLYRISSWGWATWRDRWEDYSYNFRRLRDELRSKGCDIQKAGLDLPRLIDNEKVYSHERDIWTPGWVMAALLRDAVTLWPKHSMVQNIGMDGTGMNCRTSKKYDVRHRLWSPEEQLILPHSLEVKKDIQREFLSFTANRNNLRSYFKNKLSDFLRRILHGFTN